jgi:collagenase-like PrtC family protease
VDDVTTLKQLSGRVPLVIGPGVQCESAAALRQLMELGARRWVIPAVCKGEAMQVLSYAGNAGCEIELPVLSSRKFSRWRCRVESCPYEDWPRHALPGCDLDASPEDVIPNWACDITTLRAAGVAILRVTPRHVRDVALSQTLGELVRGEIDARQAYAQYAATLDTRSRTAADREPWRPGAGYQASSGFR